MDKIEELKQLIKSSNNIVLFTGAGISVPSGIPDFRSANGIYNEKYGMLSPEEIISHSFFMASPDIFYKFYKEKMVYQDALPNPGHLYFKKLEDEGKIKAVITQNIDGLHQLAGNKNVIEVHGSILRNHCMKCGKSYELKDLYNSLVPRCSCGGIIKPDVVLYEEPLDMNLFDEAIRYIRNADLLIIVGTSLVVAPASSLVTYFRGRKIVVINKDNRLSYYFDALVINDDIVNVVKQLD